MLKILFAASELFPLIKTGGLADVAGALPVALKDLRNNVRAVLPYYGDVALTIKRPRKKTQITIPGILGFIDILESKIPNTSVPVYLIDYPSAFARKGNPYVDEQGEPWHDNAERFGLFSKVINLIAMNQAGLDWKPDVVHCNDWQTGLVPALLYTQVNRPRILFTIHNLAYQGIFPQSTFQSLGLDTALWSPTALEFFGQLSFIKGGLVFADRVNTVSPRYAQEIQTPEFGNGLDGLLRYRSSVLSGIINGIDDTQWDPLADPHIDRHYDIKHIEHKSINKQRLQAHFGLAEKTQVFLLGFIGRLVEQKGLDLILSNIERLAQLPIQLVFLGTGDHKIQTALQKAMQNHPQQIAGLVGYDEVLAHRIEAGVDAFLMPSRFEPCGLNQLYSLRYGSVPIVHQVGGLADTVEDVGIEFENLEHATGFVFPTPDKDVFYNTIVRAFNAFQQPKVWHKIMRNGMDKRYNWRKSATQYVKLYKDMLNSSALTGE